MKQNEDTLQEVIDKLGQAFNEMGNAIKELSIELAKRLQVLTGPIVATAFMKCDDKLQLWYKQYETAKGRKRARLKKKIRKREQQYIARYMKQKRK